MRITRRRFLQYGLGAGAALTMPWASRTSAATAVRGGTLTKFVQPVPLPGKGIVLKGSQGLATPAGITSLTVGGFARNLAAATLGNVVGGAILVGVVYWFVYLRPTDGHLRGSGARSRE